MEEKKRTQLEAQLKEMLGHLDRSPSAGQPRQSQWGAGNIIRRRRGEKDKRFFCSRHPRRPLLVNSEGL